MKRILLVLSLLVVLSLLAWSANPCWPDVLHLKSGVTIEGEITAETETHVTITLPLGSVDCARGEIERIEYRDSPAEIYRRLVAKAKTISQLRAVLAWCETNKYDMREVIALLREATADERRRLHPEMYCRTCDAYGDLSCPKCKGDKYVPASCSTCQGSGKIACDRCQAQGTRRCAKCNGAGTIMAACPSCSGGGHVYCTHCGGDGRVRCPRHVRRFVDGKPRPCPNCGSTSSRPGTIKCPQCRGNPRRVCSMCNGARKTRQQCDECEGSGWVTCVKCAGNKKVPCPQCNGRGIAAQACPKCAGDGRITCATCGGDGIAPSQKD